MIAVKDNRLMIAERLLDMGADVNTAAKVNRAQLNVKVEIGGRFWTISISISSTPILVT